MLESSAKLTFIIHGLGTRPFLFEQSEQLVKSKVELSREKRFCIYRRKRIISNRSILNFSISFSNI